MGKDLKALIRLRRFEVDECQRMLGELYRAEGELNAREAQLEAAMAKEEVFAKENPDLGFTLGAYVARYLGDKEALADHRRQLEAALNDARDNLAEAYRTLKVVQISQENREKREREERDLKEQKTLDEIGLTLHRRRKEVE
ncbi:MAG: flagellar export protein FliJ [Rhodospirillum sp.]|nr:flagellar export protein FliJ [Rhodospirillum sp.]MCF8490448.1 flagellar export protein FliJ [Rhodospirillum sp.]MCF8500461.1 flagellar export protein FliJ [Rhodospirillum sp.]